MTLVSHALALLGISGDLDAAFLVPLDDALRTPTGVCFEGDGLQGRGKVEAARSASAFNGVRTLLVATSPTPVSTGALVSVEDVACLALLSVRCLLESGDDLDLVGAQLRASTLAGASLRGADLTGADLRGADLAVADLTRACLCGADLRGADLQRASLRGADLTECDLRRADLRGCNLREAVLDRAALRGADMWSATVWNVDFSAAFTEGTEIDRADHRGTGNI
jgi:hypothetical protein